MTVFGIFQKIVEHWYFGNSSQETGTKYVPIPTDYINKKKRVEGQKQSSMI